MIAPHSLDIRTVVVLFHGTRFLLLRRANWKHFAPNRWTGLGGKVESEELGDLEASALRETFEETDLQPSEVSRLRLHRTLTFYHPDEGLVCLLYFAGTTTTDRTPACAEGSLAWLSAADLARLDLIENTGQVLPLLIEDVQTRNERVHCGVAHYDDHGHLKRIVFD